MKKVKLTGVNVTNFTKFIGTLANLSQASTIYFTIDGDKVISDSYIESKSLIKSLRYNLTDFFEESDIDATVKCTFYSGRKLASAFSYLKGTNITVTIECAEYDGDTFCSKFTITDGKLRITLKGSDPALIEFVSVPGDAISKLTNCDNAQNAFQINANELKQIKSMEKFDTNPYITFIIDDHIKVSSDNSFEIEINDNLDQVNTKGEYKVDKSLLALVEEDTYSAYTFEDKIILKSVDGKITNVVALTDTVD